MFILGISCYYHDAGACILHDGIVESAAEQERFTRIKHDHRFPDAAIKFCLEHSNISVNDLDYVVFYEKPGIKINRILKTIYKHFPRSKDIFKEVFINWGKQKNWISKTIQSRLGIPKNKILFSEHHLSHAASSYYCSPYNDAAILTVDGVGEWVTTSMISAKGTNFLRHEEINFPHSIGLLYSTFTEFLGFEVNEGEFKVMGLAPYGVPKFKDKVYQHFLSITPDSFELDMDYFAYEWSLTTNMTRKFIDYWGTPRPKEEPFIISKYSNQLNISNNGISQRVVDKNQYYADVAASVQEVIEEVMLKFVNTLYNKTKTNNLCISGGVGYNSVANGRIIRDSKFDNVYILPAAGDSGASVGASLALYHSMHDRPVPQIVSSSYLGKNFSDNEIRQVLEKKNITYDWIEDEYELFKRIAYCLSKGKVIGWFQGRFEFGPRALGHRSILADPRNISMKHKVNSKIKFRESFRPFAPVCIYDHVNDYFEMNEDIINLYPFQFMLAVAKVKPEYTNLLQAVTHVDNSARLQIVKSDTNNKLYKLIKYFGDITGIYCLLNTSFNRRGEVIVNSPQDALITFEWSGIDILVMGNAIIQK